MVTYRARRIAVDGGELHVGQWGPDDGPTLVAVHGITASHLAWAALAEAMPDVRIVAPDLRGRGQSSALPGPWGMERHATDVAAVLGAVGPAVLVGHSMGAFVVNATAHLFPEKVRAVLLVDGGLTLDLPPGAMKDTAADLLGPAAARLEMTFADRETYRQFWRAHPALKDEWPPTMDAYVDYDLVGEPPAMRSRTSADAMRQDAVELYGTPLVDASVAGIRPDTTLLIAPRGLQNETPGLYSPAAITRWHSVLPKLDVVEVDDVNHYTILMGERGAAVVAAYARALAG